MYVVWANHYFYYPYECKTAYLRLNMQDGGYSWTLDKNQASQFSDFQDANQWYKSFLEDESDQQSRTTFDIVLGIGKV